MTLPVIFDDLDSLFDELELKPADTAVAAAAAPAFASLSSSI
jgi:hypothetical protein